MNDKIKSLLAILGDFSSLIIVPLFLWAWWSIQTSIALNRAQSESQAKDTYVLKAEFQASIAVLKDSQVKLWEKHDQAVESSTTRFNEIYLSLQHINDTANVIKQQTK